MVNVNTMRILLSARCTPRCESLGSVNLMHKESFLNTNSDVKYVILQWLDVYTAISKDYICMCICECRHMCICEYRHVCKCDVSAGISTSVCECVSADVSTDMCACIKTCVHVCIHV